MNEQIKIKIINHEKRTTKIRFYFPSAKGFMEKLVRKALAMTVSVDSLASIRPASIRERLDRFMPVLALNSLSVMPFSFRAVLICSAIILMRFAPEVSFRKVIQSNELFFNLNFLRMDLVAMGVFVSVGDRLIGHTFNQMGQCPEEAWIARRILLRKAGYLYTIRLLFLVQQVHPTFFFSAVADVYHLAACKPPINECK